MKVSRELAHGIRPRVDETGSAELLRGHNGRTDLHFTVGQGRAILDCQHPFALDDRGIIHIQRGGGIDDRRAWVDRGDILAHCLNPGRIRAVHLVDHNHIRQAQGDFAGVVGELVTRAVRIDNGDLQVRPGRTEKSLLPPSHRITSQPFGSFSAARRMAS